MVGHHGSVGVAALPRFQLVLVPVLGTVGAALAYAASMTGMCGTFVAPALCSGRAGQDAADLIWGGRPGPANLEITNIGRLVRPVCKVNLSHILASMKTKLCYDLRQRQPKSDAHCRGARCSVAATQQTNRSVRAALRKRRLSAHGPQTSAIPP